MFTKFRRSNVLSILLVLSLALAACSSPAAQPAATTAPTVAATSAPVATEVPTEAATTAPTAAATSAPTVAATEAMTSTAALPATGNSTVMVTNNSALGNILTDAKGMTLYAWKKDTTPGQSACTGGCATAWPPLTVPQGATPSAGSGVTGTLGTIQRADGSTQVTVNKQPLYYFQGDKNPGDAKGQGVGNVWYVVGADGNMITTGGTAPAAGGTGTPTAAAPTMVATPN